MHISAIWRYPVKSLGGETLESVDVGRLGPAWDRRWMVTDPNGVYITQREEPRLALARASMQSGQLVVLTETLETLRVPVEPDSGRRLRVQVWRDSCASVALGGIAREWFSDFLGRHCELVYLPEVGGRQVDPEYGEARDRTSFTDGYPFLIIGQSSLDDLNARLDEPLPMNRFRPNLVVEGAEPYAEDGWQRVSIGDMTLRVVKPCPRCVVTTTDQETAETGSEPLRTLSTYRITDGKVMFGMNAVHDGPGKIDTAETVRILGEAAL